MKAIDLKSILKWWGEKWSETMMVSQPASLKSLTCSTGVSFAQEETGYV